jgi:ferric-dicitrate binding protein FerR (iron transport regulator)
MPPGLSGGINKQTMTKEIISIYLNNRCTEEELNEVLQWINTNAENKEDINGVFDIWKNYRAEDNMWNDEKCYKLFDKIKQKIDQNAQQTEIRNNRVKPVSVYITWLTRVAAILLLPVLAYMFLILSEKKMVTGQYMQKAVDSLEIIAPVGSRTVVHLSDGSEVHLNYGSKLKYPQIFSGDKRGVVLEGEGYFDVSHNPEEPFVVHAGKLQIIALGTSFNVNAYPGEDKMEATLVNGKVVIEKTEASGSMKPIVTMLPGQHVSCNNTTGVIACSQGRVEKYIAWKDGKMFFEDACITHVAEKLSRMFNVEIEVKDNAKDYLYTVTFVDEPLNQILDLMTIATPVKYIIMQRKKLVDGTFSKQKIIIEKK